MFGPKIRNVFKSRWQAVFWSLSILATAYCSVPSPDDSKPNAHDQEAIDKLMARFAPLHQQAQHHINPWAKTPGNAH